MAGVVLACVVVAGRWIVIVGCDCYPYLPSTLVYFGVANDRRKKAPVKGLVFNVWPSVAIVAFYDAMHTLTFHAQK